MSAKARGETVRLKVTCLHPPPALCEGRPTEFGLQEGMDRLVAGRPDAAGEALVCECEAEARPDGRRAWATVPLIGGGWQVVQ